MWCVYCCVKFYDKQNLKVYFYQNNCESKSVCVYWDQWNNTDVYELSSDEQDAVSDEGCGDTASAVLLTVTGGQ